MTVAQLIERLRKIEPSREVKVWDNRRERFTDRFYVEPASLDQEVFITPSEFPPDLEGDQGWSQPL